MLDKREQTEEKIKQTIAQNSADKFLFISWKRNYGTYKNGSPIIK